MCPDKVLDPSGHHAFTCRRGPEVISRHNILRNTIFDSARMGMLNPALEQGASLDEAGSPTRPADDLIPGWSLGKSGVIDVTVVLPLNPTLIDGASTTPGYYLQSTERRKHQQNDTKCKELNWFCLPVAITPYG